LHANARQINVRALAAASVVTIACLGLMTTLHAGALPRGGPLALTLLRWVLACAGILLAPGLPLAILTHRGRSIGIAELIARAVLLGILLGAISCTTIKLCGIVVREATVPYALGAPALVFAIWAFLSHRKTFVVFNDFGPDWRALALCCAALALGMLALHGHILPGEDQYLPECIYDRVRQWAFPLGGGETPRVRIVRKGQSDEQRFLIRQSRVEWRLVNGGPASSPFLLRWLVRNYTTKRLFVRVRFDGKPVAGVEVSPRYDRFKYSRNFPVNAEFISARLRVPLGEHRLEIRLTDRPGRLVKGASVVVDDLSNFSRHEFWQRIRRRYVIGDIGDVREPVNFARSLRDHLLPFVFHHDLPSSPPPSYSLADPPLHHHLAMLALSAMGDDIRSITALYWFEILLVYLLTVWLSCSGTSRPNLGAVACIPMVWVLTTFIRPGLESNTPHLTFCMVFLLGIALLRAKRPGYFLLAAAMAMMTKPHGLAMALFALLSMGIFFPRRRKESAVLGVSCIAAQLVLVGVVCLIDRLWGPVMHKDVIGFRAGTLGRVLLHGQWRWAVYLLRNATDYGVLLVAASCFAPLFCWRGTDRWGRVFLLTAGLAFLMIATMNYVRCHYVGTVSNLLLAAAVRAMASPPASRRKWSLYFASAIVSVVWCFATGSDHTSPWAGPLVRSRVSPFCRAASLERRANDALLRGGRMEAVRLLRQAVSFGYPQDVTWARLVRVLIEDGKVKCAYAAAEEAVLSSTRPATLFRVIGMELYVKGQYAHALAFLSRSLQRDPENVDVMYESGNALVRLGQYYAAERRFREVLARKPNHVKALTNLGMVLLSSGRAREALSPLRRALGLNPKIVAAHFNLALALEE